MILSTTEIKAEIGGMVVTLPLRASGLSYYEAQNAAGVAQIIFHAIGKGAPGQGVPVFHYPYGDQVQDAVDVQRGYEYVKALEQGTCH